MLTAPVEEADLPPFTNMRAVCSRCARHVRAYVMFDRDCRWARGDHYHRRCTVCEHEWIHKMQNARRAVRHGPELASAKVRWHADLIGEARCRG